MNLEDVLKRPLITEKSMAGTTLGQYAFAVDRRATKKEISQAVAKFFKVHPQQVKTINVKGKPKGTRKARHKTRSPDWKKAMVTLKEGEKIEIFEANE